ncbi:hypothetical protein H6P1_00604 (plasmid) [Variovorax sp. PBL-H6]|nr:hypothetical protein SRS16P1_00325 [Variovorax sp. SRS16]VTU42688.1 hypothetical protein E5P1_00323 [Variovorax sp. PBL-E5]VTU43854.1 hypothetical protein H6P1_00604 [Variovorax sp. PBL-H6]
MHIPPSSRPMSRLLATSLRVLANPRSGGRTARFSRACGGPPLVFRHGASGALWLIDVGQPFVFLAAWSVYALERGPSPSCRIDFRPASAKDASALLPEPTAALVRLLDKAIGSGAGEGTQQPTAWIQVDVQHTLANAALRPWAVQQPFNSRSEVDSGLAEWAGKDTYNRQLFQAFGMKYPAAERALAAHYRHRFHLGRSQSKRMAAYSLDVAFRSHFTFPKENTNTPGGNPAPANPWHSFNPPRDGW